MSERLDLDTLRERNIQLRRDLARAFQEAEQVVLNLSNSLVDVSAEQQSNARLNLRQTSMIRDKFLAAWQELSKEEWTS